MKIVVSHIQGSTGLRPVVSGVAPETVCGVVLHQSARHTSSASLMTKSGVTPDLTGATPVPPTTKTRHDLRAILQRAHASSAFTLIEVVISAALMALILVSAYLCLSAGIAGKRMVEPRADIFQNARVTLALLSADLRGACVLPGDSAFLGMKRMIGDVEADNLDFATHNYTPRHANEGDFCETSYYVEKNPQSGRLSLWRRRNPTLAPEPLEGGNKEPVAENILGLQLEYSDGTDWYENWGEVKGAAKAQNSQSDQSNLSGLPNAVRITLLLDSDPDSKPDVHTGERKIEPPLVFQTVAFLNLAEAARDAANDTSSSSQSSSDQSSPQTPNGGSQ